MAEFHSDISCKNGPSYTNNISNNIGSSSSSNYIGHSSNNIGHSSSSNNNINDDLTSLNSSDSFSDEITYKDGMIEVAPLPLLIYRLVPTSTYYPDKSYIFAFLLNSRVFLTPHQLFQQVCEACKQQESLLDKQNIESTASMCQNMVRLLGLWTDNFAYDFRDERMIILLKEMNSLILKHHLHFKKEITIITQNLYSKLQALHKYEDLLDKINMEVSSRTNNLLPTTDITETCPNPLFLGHQLTHIELERLSMIGPEEFIQDHALRSSSSPVLKKLTNIDSYVHWYNRLSYFVATEICMHLKKKNRARMIEYFVDVAKECINIGNFNSLMAILGGLNMPAIQRLKKTWAKVNKEKFEILERLSNPCGNFNSYRSSLKAALWRSEGASDDRERIIVPFFSVMLKDIYMLNENKELPDRFSNGHVNFKKIWEVTKVVNEFMAWKQVECPFERSPPVLNYLLTNPVFSENSLTSASYECEQPDTAYEKQHFKQLKEQAGS